MEINFLSPGFIVPSILNVLMLMIPITIFSGGILSWFRTALYAIALHAVIILTTI